jgi:hypothetical protein
MDFKKVKLCEMLDQGEDATLSSAGRTRRLCACRSLGYAVAAISFVRRRFKTLPVAHARM